MLITRSLCSFNIRSHGGKSVAVSFAVWKSSDSLSSWPYEPCTDCHSMLYSLPSVLVKCQKEWLFATSSGCFPELRLLHGPELVATQRQQSILTLKCYHSCQLVCKGHALHIEGICKHFKKKYRREFTEIDWKNLVHIKGSIARIKSHINIFLRYMKIMKPISNIVKME